MKRNGDNIDLYLRSCDITCDDPVDRNLLSKDHAIKGKLCLLGVKRIRVDDEESKEIPWKDYDDGQILDLEIGNDKVFLFIEWTDYPPKPRRTDYSSIEIEAEKIYWENIPDLVSP